MIIEAIKAFSDNYIWSLVLEEGIILVDPGESGPVFEYLADKRQDLAAVLLTHKHEDHVGGVAELKERFPEMTIYGPKEIVKLNDQTVYPGDTIEIFGKVFEILDCSGHTPSHVAYLVDDELFCGDALFMAGCGRVFTGDYEASYQTLQTFKSLSDKVRVYAGHEYGAKNLRFALSVGFNEDKVRETLEKVEELTELGVPALPSTIGLEKQINPFFSANSLEDFIQLRNQRDEF